MPPFIHPVHPCSGSDVSATNGAGSTRAALAVLQPPGELRVAPVAEGDEGRVGGVAGRTCGVGGAVWGSVERDL